MKGYCNEDRVKSYFSAFCMKKCEVFKNCKYQTRHGKLRKECEGVTWVRKGSEMLRASSKYRCRLDCKNFHFDGEKYVCLENKMLPTDYVLKMKY